MAVDVTLIDGPEGVEEELASVAMGLEVAVGDPELDRLKKDMDRLKKVWGANLAAARARRGWSQARLGAECDPPIHQSSIAKYEAGDTKPLVPKQIALARALGRNPAKLFPLTLPEE